MIVREPHTVESVLQAGNNPTIQMLSSKIVVNKLDSNGISRVKNRLRAGVFRIHIRSKILVIADYISRKL